MEHCVRSIPCERAEVTLMNKQASYHTAPGAYAQTEREFYTKIWNGPTCLQKLLHKFEYELYNENLNSQQV